MSSTIAYYERLCQEDLDTGVGTSTKRNPGGGTLTGTQIGIHTLGLGQAARTATKTPGAIAAGAVYTTTLAYPGAAVNDFVLATMDSILTTALQITGHVSAADVVTVVISNLTGVEVTVATGIVKVLVLPSRTVADVQV